MNDQRPLSLRPADQHDARSLIEYEGAAVCLTSPTDMPSASSFLWNKTMMLQLSCRGYATAQFMQPEPSKYARGPSLEATTFMQPEQPYYAHHPGRFFYIKDLESGALFSSPHEPVRAKADVFEFTALAHKVSWRVVSQNIEVVTSVSLSADRPLELWQTTVTNLSSSARQLSLTPYFPVGYMSWMNQSADYDHALSAVICRSITPYQKYADYFKNKDLKDLTFLIAERSPDSFDAQQQAFEGEGGLHNPSALQASSLGNNTATYEMPTAAMQYKIALKAGESESFRFAFGPAKDDNEIADIRSELFGAREHETKPAKSASSTGFERAVEGYKTFVERSKTNLTVSTPDKEFDHYVNHWLSRQMFYHGDVNRLSTDPQTRNYLQDNMGMTYVKPSVTRNAFLTALKQQHTSGAMPDGILLNDNAELKYINQVPHMDHCVWLPVCISAYLDETNDYALLDEVIGFGDSAEQATVFEHISRALRWLHSKRDHRGLNYIEQGDWCDPMNMVGYKGVGVSGWLTLAAAYACKLWSQVSEALGRTPEQNEFLALSEACNASVNTHIWDGNWYGRGITDDGVLFGIESDNEGKIFLNPQSWAMLSGAADKTQEDSIIAAIETHLDTPYGVQMLAPAFTKMRDDIGRVTQKHPGSAENGSIYNHAAAFYLYALYQRNHGDRAYQVMRKMIPSDDERDLRQRGQLPVFIPNYYRGAYQQFKHTAGRSSQLFNTGTVHWFYRSLIDGLFGVQGTPQGLRIAPQLPSHWPKASIVRRFRGAEFTVDYVRDSKYKSIAILVDENPISGNIITDVKSGVSYVVKVHLPVTENQD